MVLKKVTSINQRVNINLTSVAMEERHNARGGIKKLKSKCVLLTLRFVRYYTTRSRKQEV